MATSFLPGGICLRNCIVLFAVFLLFESRSAYGHNSRSRSTVVTTSPYSDEPVDHVPVNIQEREETSNIQLRASATTDETIFGETPGALCRELPPHTEIRQKLRRYRKQRQSSVYYGRRGRELQSEAKRSEVAAFLPTVSARLGFDTSARDLYDVYLPTVPSDSSLRRSLGWSVRLTWPLGDMIYTARVTSLREKQNDRRSQVESDMDAMLARSYRAEIFCATMLNEQKNRMWYKYLTDLYAILDAIETMTE